MSNNIKQIFFLGACAFFLACGASSNERGIASTTADSTASGSAYRSYDGFAPAAAGSSPQTAAAPTAPTGVITDSTSVGAAAATVAAQPGITAVINPGAAQPAAAKPAAKPADKPAAADDNAEVKRGEALIAKSDCLACHKVDARQVGPAYKEVANKYPNNSASINQLADKIKKGGSGVWGAIPMTPHPTLSDDDAKAMAKYVLSLK
jgi:cytochrome c